MVRERQWSISCGTTTISTGYVANLIKQMMIALFNTPTLPMTGAMLVL